MLNNNVDLATLIVGILAFIGVVIEIIITVVNHQKDIEMQIVTSNRVAWMSELRQNISKCCLSVNMLKKEELQNWINEFELYKHQTFLLLNYNDEKDNHIRSILNIIGQNLQNYAIVQEADNKVSMNQLKEKLHLATDYLVKYVSIYLKCEWTRVKYFSKKGEKNKFNFNSKFDDYYSKVKEEMNALKNKVMGDE